MRYLMARESKDEQGKPTGKWHFTERYDNDIVAVGYCARNCPGHATSQEAAEHYRQYMLDIANFDAQRWEREEPCRVCGALTVGLAVIPGHHLPVTLCEIHRNREGLAQAMPIVEMFILS